MLGWLDASWALLGSLFILIPSGPSDERPILWVGLSGLLYHFALRKSRGLWDALLPLIDSLTEPRVVGNFPPGWWVYVSLASSGLGYLLGNGTLQTSLPPFLHRFYCSPGWIFWLLSSASAVWPYTASNYSQLLSDHLFVTLGLKNCSIVLRAYIKEIRIGI